MYTHIRQMQTYNMTKITDTFYANCPKTVLFIFWRKYKNENDYMII